MLEGEMSSMYVLAYSQQCYNRSVTQSKVYVANTYLLSPSVLSVDDSRTRWLVQVGIGISLCELRHLVRKCHYVYTTYV